MKNQQQSTIPKSDGVSGTNSEDAITDTEKATDETTTEHLEKDKSAKHYALRDRQEIDYNEERMAEKQHRSEDQSKQIKHDNRKNSIEVCSPTEICRKCGFKINNFELGDDDLSEDEYEERLIEASIVNISANRSLASKDLLRILKEQAKSVSFPDIDITGLKTWFKKNYAVCVRLCISFIYSLGLLLIFFRRNINDTLSNLRATTKIDGFDVNQWDLIKRILEYKLMHLIAGHGNQLDVSLMDENTYTSTVISQDFEFLKLCFPGLFVSQWNENDVPSSKWRRELIYGTGALARRADGILFMIAIMNF